jgi:hypothetical protein
MGPTDKAPYKEPQDIEQLTRSIHALDSQRTNKLFQLMEEEDF